MNILGINFSHDASVTLLRNGRVVCSIEEEKISRVKQDHGWPRKALDVVLRQHGLGPADIDIVAFGSHFYRELAPAEIRYRFRRQSYLQRQEEAGRVLSYVTGRTQRRFAETNRAVFERELSAAGFSKAKVLFFNHHLSHAAGAFYCAPFTPDLIVTCDGHGDGDSFNFYRLDPASGLQAIETNGYAVSVGAFYSAITSLLGFRPTRHEGKITGLAAYGRPSRLVDDFSKLFWRDEEGRLRRYPDNQLEEEWRRLGLASRLGLRRRINLHASESRVGVDYARRFEVLRQRLAELTAGFSKEDIAFACQAVSERVVIDEIRRVMSRHFEGRKITVGLAGGVFANVRINQKIYELEDVENVFIQPAMGDSGLAIGAAILADLDTPGRTVATRQYAFTDTYLGPAFDDTLPAFLDSIRADAHVERLQQPAAAIASLMRDNVIVGLWQGPMEWGPRALGNRSIILNTFDRTVNDSLNKRLTRTEFMPFAPSVIDTMASTYFPAYVPSCPAADYMTMTYDVPAAHHDRLQAVVHVDGTARPQVVTRATNPYYYEILEAFLAATGCGAIVNTSFNAHEEPIVSTAASAYRALADGRIDVLVLNDFKITMRKNPSATA